MVASAIGVHKASTRNPLWYVTGVLFSAWVMALLDRMILIILFPGLKASLHLSDTQISLLHGPAFSIVYALAGLPLGRIVDRSNRRNLLFLGVIGWSLATMASGLANSFGALIAARLVVGICQAVLAPASLSMVADCCSPERRGRTTALVISGATVGGAASSMLGGIVLDFFAAHPVTMPFGGHLAPWQPTLILAGAPGLIVALILLTIHEPDRQSVAAGPAFKILPYLARNWTTFAPLYAASTLSLAAVDGSSPWYPMVLMRDLHMAPHEAGITLGVVTLLGAFVSAIGGGFLNDRFARRDRNGGRLVLVRWLVLLNAVVLLPLFAPTRLFWIVASLFLNGILATTTSATFYTILPELAPNEGRGQAITLFLLFGNLIGHTLAPTAVALVTDQVFRNESLVNYSILIVCVPALLLAALFAQIALPGARRVRQALADAEIKA